MINRRRREQEGYFHVWLRGNGRFNVFYTDEDHTDFLKRCDESAKVHNTKIFAFVLMANHIHLSLYTTELTDFIKSVLIGYVQSYNRRHKLSDKLFRTPFSSSKLASRFQVAENILYILNNPVKAGICNHPKEYRWSSYHFYDSKQAVPLMKHINIDCAPIDEIFFGKENLNKAIESLTLTAEPKPNIGRVRIPESEVIEHMNKLLNGRSLGSLNSAEIEKLIINLNKQTLATYRQIASVTHSSYNEVRGLCRS